LHGSEAGVSWGTAGDVRFDWTGSLRVARRLWALADEIEATMSSRVGHAEYALVDWLGAYGTQFADRVNDETAGAGAVVAGLREGANGWAFQWKSAMDEQNRRLHARAEQRAKDDRNIGEQVWGFFAGHDDLPPKPSEAAIPTPPSFAATRGFARF
jgi:hypothetical protein